MSIGSVGGGDVQNGARACHEPPLDEVNGQHVEPHILERHVAVPGRRVGALWRQSVAINGKGVRILQCIDTYGRSQLLHCLAELSPNLRRRRGDALISLARPNKTRAMLRVWIGAAGERWARVAGAPYATHTKPCALTPCARRYSSASQQHRPAQPASPIEPPSSGTANRGGESRRERGALPRASAMARDHTLCVSGMISAQFCLCTPPESFLASPPTPRATPQTPR